MDTLRTLATIGVVYMGTGFLVSRFFDSRFKNFPLTWVFFSAIFLPVITTALSFFPLPHAFVVFFSIACIIAGMIVGTPPKQWMFAVLPETHRLTRTEFLSASTLLFLFLCSLILLKLPLITTNQAPIPDDAWRVPYVVSLGTDLAQPKLSVFPLGEFRYYYHDVILPAVLFRTTSLSASAAWVVHTALEYCAVLGFFFYVVSFLLRTRFARFYALFGLTFAGGFTYFLYRILNQPVVEGMDWWIWLLPIAQGLNIQITMPFVIFAYVPPHLMGAVAFLFAILLACRPNPANHFLLPVLFAAIFGFSTFVFLPASLAFLTIQIVLLIRNHGRQWKRLTAQLIIFLVLAAKMIFVLSGGGNIFSFWLAAIPFFDFAPHTTESLFVSGIEILEQVANFFVTVPFVFWIDMGVFPFLGILFFVLYGKEIWRSVWRKSDPLHFALFAVILVPLAIGAVVRSAFHNELLLRGIIISQFSLILCGGLLLDRVIPRMPKMLLSILIVILLIQAVDFGIELKAKFPSTWNGISPVYAFIRNETPKDAMIFTDDDSCLTVTFIGNRPCQANIDELGPFSPLLRLRRPSDADPNYHDLTTVLGSRSDHPTFFVSTSEISNPRLREVVADRQHHLYAISHEP